MASGLKALWRRLTGASGADTDRDTGGEAVDYDGYRIRPIPYPSKGQYQTCGIIEKAVAGETKQHRFVRAETHPSREGAIAFSISKAKQLIDEQGDRLFH
jgi:hypothetical protein